MGHDLTHLPQTEQICPKCIGETEMPTQGNNSERDQDELTTCANCGKSAEWATLCVSGCMDNGKKMVVITDRPKEIDALKAQLSTNQKECETRHEKRCVELEAKLLALEKENMKLRYFEDEKDRDETEREIVKVLKENTEKDARIKVLEEALKKITGAIADFKGDDPSFAIYRAAWLRSYDIAKEALREGADK
jgi:DNA repair exonuclease SbcCD ATPase subunit